MNQCKKVIFTIAATCGLLILILDAKTASFGAYEGIQLCVKTLIPSLFPLFVVSGYTCQLLSTFQIPLFKPLLYLCGMPPGTESFLIMGLLGGYPVGAKVVSSAYTDGLIDKNTAKRMLGFCSNAGPAFVFGVVGNIFKDFCVPWLLLAILISSAILTAWLLPPCQKKMLIQQKQPAITFAKNFEGALHAIANVCGWVILFRVILAILNRWLFWLFPEIIQIILTGILDLSNGCLELTRINDDSIKFIICAGMLSFGGICVFMQTISVVGQLGTGYYFPGKLLQCVISIFFATIVQQLYFKPEHGALIISIIIPSSAINLIFVIFHFLKNKKTVAFPEPLMYNKGNYIKRGSKYAVSQKNHALLHVLQQRNTAE